LNALARKGGAYLQVFTLGVQNTVVYRWNFLMRTAVSLVPLVATYFLWGAAFRETTSIAGYSYATMMAYYFTLVILDSFTAPTEDDFQIAADIRDGKISQILLKPVNYFVYRFLLYLSGRLIYVAVAALPLALLLWWFRAFFAGVPVAQTALPAAFAFAGSAALQFTISFITGLIAFWLLEVGSVVFMLFSLEYLAGGHVFPLDLLPEPWRSLALGSPFGYEYFFPAAVFLGRITGPALWWGFVAQAAWIVVLLAAAGGIWKLGLRKYTAVGN
jgi:ABC-2 type transport system permease protein